MITRLQRLEAMYDYLYRKSLIHNKKDLCLAVGIAQATLSRAFSGDEKYLTASLLTKINNYFGRVFNLEWINTGEGDMLSVGENNAIATIANYRTIPLNNFGKIEKISLGSLFPSATSAVVLNDAAFDVYPKGTILVLKEVNKEQPICGGKDYYIETAEFHAARCVQDYNDHLVGYSYNDTKFPDGTCVFSPIHIDKSDILKLHLIIGAIVRN